MVIESTRKFYIGLDLGQRRDYTALVVIEKEFKPYWGIDWITATKRVPPGRWCVPLSGFAWARLTRKSSIGSAPSPSTRNCPRASLSPWMPPESVLPSST